MRRNTYSILRGAFLFVLLLGVTQCASYQEDIKEMKIAYRSSSYERALAALDKSPIKPNGKNRLLYLLEKSQILESMGRTKESRAALIKADKVVDELYTVSVSKEAATYIFNESAQAYGGEDFEKVAIHAMLSLSFLKENDLAAARVEARRINTRLNEINQEYEKKNRYSEDAFARYLAGMIYESRGEIDSAIVDYRKAVKTYEGAYQKLFKTETPRSLLEALARLYKKRGRNDDLKRLKANFPRILGATRPLPRGKGEIVVIHTAGNIATKMREEFVLPIGKEIVRFSFPIIRPKSTYAFGKTGITVEGNKFSPADLSQNLDQIASKTLEDRRLRLTLKAGARLILKSQLTQQAAKEFGPLGQIAGNIFGAVTETADTRSWTLLPSMFFISRVPVDAGEHRVKIQTNGKVSGFEKVSVKAGGIAFLVD
ncbi:MAG: hypothetical protein HRU19_10835 [Pseudobacteriovorax sp.]|nr:hypothetical protein [Pseudobacteriovorax sp.]